MTDEQGELPDDPYDVACNELVALTRSWTAHAPISPADQKKAKEIGVRLNEFGGIHAMRTAYYWARAHNAHTSVLQHYWDDIGEWKA